MNRYIAGIIIFFSFLCATSQVVAQTTTITGIVTDSITEEPLSSISVFLKGTTIAVMTDSNGRYTIRTSRTDVTEVGFTSLGYREKTIPVKMGGIRVVNASLCPSDFILQEIDVRPKKERYSRKNNPAVDFVRNLISRRDEHNPENHDYYSYDQYDKMTIALNDFSEEKKEKKIFSKFQFLFDFVDTSEITGKPILTVSIREKISKCYYRKNPESHRQKVNGIYHEGIDEIFSKEGIAAFYNEIFKEIDIFQNNISIMLTRFVSPLSTIGPAFYKYYLGDTVIVDGEKCLKLLFVPFNAESAGFVGNMYVTLDSTYFVKNLSMAVPKNINLNYVEDLIINQEFTRTSDGTRIKTKDDMVVEFQIMPGTPKLYTRRLAMYRGHSFDPFVDKETLELFNQEDRVVVDDMAEVMPASFWDDNRQVELKTQESLVGQLLEKLRSIPVYYWLEKIIKILITGYIETGHEKDMSKFDIGPMNTTLSYNSFEGLRMRVGGFTTANLNKHWFWKGYVAFGTRDHRVKYSSRVEYSFPEKDYSPAEYKVHSLALTHTYDVNQLGQQYEYTNKDNIFLSLKRKSDIRTTYLQNTELSYQREHDFGLSYGANLRYKIEESTKYVTFTENSGIDHKYYHWAEAEVHIRYAPHEKFYQSKGMRYPINRDAPILMLSHTFSPKNFLGSKFMINRTDITFAKDVWFSAFGHIESAFQVSHVWNQAPYTMLIIPNANLSYTIQEGSYSLLSPMEFVFDSYASWDVSYYANGLIFNRIPYLKVLRLREVFTFKGFFGNLSDKNNPYKTTLNPHLWSFSNKEGEYIADGNNKTLRLPYMEIAAGLDNVFKILQIEYVHRLTYRDHQNVSKHGIRIALHFSF